MRWLVAVGLAALGAVACESDPPADIGEGPDRFGCVETPPDWAQRETCPPAGFDLTQLDAYYSALDSSSAFGEVVECAPSAEAIPPPIETLPGRPGRWLVYCSTNEGTDVRVYVDDGTSDVVDVLP